MKLTAALIMRTLEQYIVESNARVVTYDFIIARCSSDADRFEYQILRDRSHHISEGLVSFKNRLNSIGGNDAEA